MKYVNNTWLVSLVLNLLLGMPLAVGSQDGSRRIEEPENQTLPGNSRIEFKSFYSPALGRDSKYSVFLPASYEDGTSRKYPVVYFLHGLWNDHTSWTVERYGGIPAHIEELQKSGAIPEFIMINPNGENSFYTDYLDGSQNFEQMIVKDLIEYVERTYRVIPDRKDRSIGGVSMGGYGALKIAMKHPELFASAMGFSPIVFAGDDPSVYVRNSQSRMAQYLVKALAPIYGMPFDHEQWIHNSLIDLARAADLDGLDIFFAYGTADRYNESFPLAAGIEALDKALTQRGVNHQYRVYQNGPHGWQLVLDHFEEAAKFLTESF
jgi:S-formylglutathione hydrolase FrmB